MLPTQHRLHRRSDFVAVTRSGVRAAGAAVVVHLLTDSSADAATPVRVGFVVGRVVGGSVVRHLVTRRLRHDVAPVLGHFPSGSRVVIRALAPAASCTNSELKADLQSAIIRAVSKAERVAVAKPDSTRNSRDV